MAQRFFNQEADYERFLAAGPGYVCNNIHMGAPYHRLHHSDCSVLNRAEPASLVDGQLSRRFAALISTISLRL